MASALSRRLATAGALVVLFAIAALALYGFSSPLTTRALPNGGLGDTAQEVWFLAWIPYAIRHFLDPLWTSLIEAPSGVNLANNTPFPALGLLAAPVTASLGPVAAYNLLLRLAPVLGGVAMTAALRTQTRRFLPAAVGGALFGFGPFVLAQANGDGHLNLETLALLPLIALALGRVLSGSDRARDGALLGALVGLQALVSEEVLGEFALVLALLGAFALVRRPRATYRRAAGLWRPALAALAVGALLAGWLIYGVLAARGHLSGPVQSSAVLQRYRADLLGPLVPTRLELLAPTGLAARAATFTDGNVSENGAYLGIALVLLLVVLGVVGRRRALVRASALGAVVAFVLSLGNRLTVDGHPSAIPLPEALLARLPLADNAVPARFGAEVLLFAAALLAFGLDEAWDRLGAMPRARRQLGVGALVVGLVASAALVVPDVPLNSRPLAWPSSLASTLESIPSGAVVLTYPIPKAPYAEAMIWQADAGMRFSLVGGYLTIRGPSGSGQLYPQLLSPPYPEELFLEAQEGPSSEYPSVAAPSEGDEALLCTMLRNNRISTVVFSDAGEEPSVVKAYLLSALGSPTARADGVLVWTRAQTRCR